MLRKSLLAVVVLMGTALLGIPGAASIPAPAPPPDEGTLTPNVVLMLVDDATVEDIEYMPNVQRLLVDQGTTFTHHYAPFPLCCPARATILTGQYAHNHGVLDNVPPIGGASVFDDSNTIATYLTDDYDTALIGKYLNGPDQSYVPPGWDVWRVPVAGTTYNFVDQKMSFNGVTRAFSDTYSTTHYSALAETFINEASRPYFAYVSWVAPHIGTPHETPDDPPSPYVEPKYQDTYLGPLVPADPTFNETDMSDKRASIQDNPLLTPEQVAAIQEKLAQRRESLQSVDDGVARIVAAVESAGQLDNTYFILVSDNGQMMGEHRIARGKAVTYEPAARVPLIIRGPGIPAAGTYNDVTGLQDITPTILTMTRQWRDQPKARMDGVSLLRLLKGSTYTNRAQVLEVTDTAAIPDTKVENGVTPTRQEAQALSSVDWRARGIVTSDRWKYTEYPMTGEGEMYDLSIDPYEEQNLFGNPLYASQQDRLKELLERYKDCRGRGCR